MLEWCYKEQTKQKTEKNMAGIDFNSEKYTTPIQVFNERYGLNFSIGAFEVQANAFAQLNSKSAFDDVYRMTFIKLYKQALGNYVDHKIDGLEPSIMLKGFNDIMEVYRKDCQEKKITTNLHARGGWKVKDALESLQKEVSALPKNKIEYAKERYLKGDLPIRDMMEYTKKTLEGDQNTFNTEKLSVLISYSKALKDVNASRSFLWKVFHPIRNNAEQKNAALIETMVQEKAKMVVYNMSETRAEQNDYRLGYSQDSISFDIENQKRLEISRRLEGKVRIEVPEAATSESKIKTTEKVQTIKAPVIEDLQFS